MRQTLTAFALCLLPFAAGAACTIRIAYIDQDRAPYYLGSGAVVRDPPGASVELLRDIAKSGGCEAQFQRLPLARIRPAILAGSVDAGALAAIGSTADDYTKFAYPIDHNGQLEKAKSIILTNVVFVRAADKVPRDVDPHVWFKNRRMGASHGTQYADVMRQAGITVDDGALDTKRNFEKLRLGRIDGFTVALASPGDMDAEVASRYGGDIVRLDKSMATFPIWFVTSKPFYNAHKREVDAMWNWLGTSGHTAFAALLKKYDPD